MSSPAPQPPAADRALQSLFVTRPAGEAADWVTQLQAQGWPALALPLIDIAEPGQPAAAQALHQQRARWASHDAILFVSGAAVKHFFTAPDVPPAAADTRTRFWAPGPGTARALIAPLAHLGLGAERIDAPPADAGQFDSEALWPVVAAQLHAGSRVLVVRGASLGAEEATSPATGGNGREWLIRRCEQAGATVEAVAAYERRAPEVTPERLDRMRMGQGPGQVWLFSSSESMDNLAAAQPQADWSRAAALVTHPRIARRATELGFGQVVQTRPALPDVLRTLESHWTRP